MTALSPVFKSLKAQAEFLAAYDAAMRLWPVSFEQSEVSTRFGTTHVIICGPKSAPPLVLLHCALMTSAIWYPIIGDLSKRFRTYAIDVMGDVGRTVPENPPQTGEELAEWLTDTLVEFGILRCRVVGWSFGGFIATNFAVHLPAQVERLALLAPFATFVRPGPGFLAGFLPLLLPTRSASRWFESKLSYRGGFGPAEHSELLYQRFKNGRVAFRVAPRTFSDSEFKRLIMPSLLLVGEQEFLYNSAAAVARAERVLPRGQAHLVARCNHAMVSDQTERVLKLLLGFLGGDKQR